MRLFPIGFRAIGTIAVAFLVDSLCYGQEFTAVPEILSTNQSARSDGPSFSWAEGIKIGDNPKWIWGDNQDVAYTLRKTVELEEIQSAWLRASGDNRVAVLINGKSVGESSQWESPVDVNVTAHLKKGTNQIEAKVKNSGGAAGFVMKLVVQNKRGDQASIVSDGTWDVVENGQAIRKVKTIANYGDAPWRDVLSGDSASGKGIFQVLPGFQIERLYTVPRDELGSWVCIALDPKGRIIASDQDKKGLVRITPSPIGSQVPTRVEKLKIDISAAQGLLHAFGSLYVCVNGPGSGLYRLRDTDGDDQYDEKVKLFEFRGGGEHGPHALRLSPDGKSIVVAGGNHTLLPFDRQVESPIQGMGGIRQQPLDARLPSNMTSRILPNWDEDVLPTRMWDANGHATGIYAPGGWMAQCDPEGKQWEILSVGYRNQYDFDYNADGDMFVYDSDMEWDMGTSWYRPTRVVHASSGSEFGWRSGTACWPTYFADSLPSLIDIGPGSPVGVSFGYGAKFPAEYQRALYICDWTFGTMYAIHLTPDGSSYRARKEEFLSRTPLPLTDVVIGADGAMYFTVGGRGTQSELFRVTYVGKEATTSVNPSLDAGADLRALRREIEKWHRQPAKDESVPLKMLVQNLSHTDRYIRYAARVALERIPVDQWWPLAKGDTSPDGILSACMGVARSGTSVHRADLLTALRSIDWTKLTSAQRVDLLRAYQLVLIRLGVPTETQRESLLSTLEPLFPSTDSSVNRELVTLLVHLDSKTLPSKVIPLLEQESAKETTATEELLARNRGYGSSIANMLANQPDLQQVHYAFVMREHKSGWNLELRQKYFQWFVKASKWAGGNSYQKFLVNISNEAFSRSTDQERLAVEALGLRARAAVPKDLPKPQGPGKNYSVDELVQKSSPLSNRNFENGRKMYSAARCIVCHRFGGDGGSTGPDLSQVAGRFGNKDLIEAIVDPSKVISDQYKTVIVSTDEGNISGRIISENDKEMILLTDPEDSSKTVKLLKSDIAGMKTSTESVMPKDLLKELNEEEVLDLLAYMLSRGNEKDPIFKR